MRLPLWRAWDIRESSSFIFRGTSHIDRTLRFQSAYFTRSSQLMHGNVIIKLFQILLPPPTPPSPTPAPDAIFGKPFPTSSLTTLDPAKSWILKASVRVQSNQDVESLNTGVNGLKGFKELLKGMCDLEVAERLALDTRVR